MNILYPLYNNIIIITKYLIIVNELEVINLLMLQWDDNRVNE